MSEPTATPAPEQTQQNAPEPQPTPEQPQAGQPNDGKREADQPLGEPGLKALQAERERADRLEKEINSLKPIQQQWDQLKSIFGDKAAGDKPEDVVKNLQAEVAQMRRENEVNSIARQFGITDEKDLAILRSANSPELMQAWGERLKPAPKSPTPEPDPGQGARTGTQSQEDSEFAQFEQFFPTTRK